MAEPYREQTTYGDGLGIAIGTQPQAAAPQRGGFWGGLDRLAGGLLPIVEAAAAFKRGYQTGLPLPGQYGEPRMAGQDLMFRVLEDMRARNEAAAERARDERLAAEERGFKQQILMQGVEQGKISYADALKALKSEDFTLGEPVTTQAPAAPKAP